MQNTVCDMEKLLAEVRDEMKDEVEKRNVEMEVDSLPVIHGDPAMLRLVWVNLLSNALKYSRKQQSPRVEIGCEERDAEYVFHVRDNGAGFDMKYVDKLFGVFQRLHRSNDFEGTGIGLANVKRIVTRHSGRVWAEGAVDNGATFYFTIHKRGKHG